MDSFDTAKVIQVIVTNLKRRGDGIDDPLRPITQYFTFDGELLATVDPYPCPSPDPISRAMYENVRDKNDRLQKELAEANKKANDNFITANIMRDALQRISNHALLRMSDSSMVHINQIAQYGLDKSKEEESK